MNSMIKLPAVGKNVYHSIAKTWDQKGRVAIRQIFVSYDSDKVHGLQFLYARDETKSSASSSVLSELFGMIGKNHFQAIQLDHPLEYLTCVIIFEHSDCTGFGIAFKTNLGKSYGPFSPGSGSKSVCYNLGAGNQFGGFYGTCYGNSLTSIGVYLRPNIGSIEPVKAEELCDCD